MVVKRGYFATFYAIAVLLHECAHYLVANKLFYRCQKIQLSIFGAVLYGEFADVTSKDSIKIALAGPVCNLCLCLVCLALWWIVPDVYPFTEVFFQANLTMAAVNLLPFYPLDGGRIASGLLQKFLKKPLDVVKKVTVIFSLLLFVMFVISLFSGHNLFNVGLFAICLFSGVLTKSDGAIYVKSVLGTNGNYFLKKGMEKKILVFNKRNTLADVAKRMQGNFLYSLEIVNDDMQVMESLSIAQLEKAVVTQPLDTTLDSLKTN